MDYNLVVFDLLLAMVAANAIFSAISFLKKWWGDFTFHVFLTIFFAAISILMNMGLLNHV
jgi:hypothetical protein